jgi:hypothetical protein
LGKAELSTLKKMNFVAEAEPLHLRPAQAELNFRGKLCLTSRQGDECLFLRFTSAVYSPCGLTMCLGFLRRGRMNSSCCFCGSSERCHRPPTRQPTQQAQLTTGWLGA